MSSYYVQTRVGSLQVDVANDMFPYPFNSLNTIMMACFVFFFVNFFIFYLAII